jgi:hypothetical protein
VCSPRWGSVSYNASACGLTPRRPQWQNSRIALEQRAPARLGRDKSVSSSNSRRRRAFALHGRACTAVKVAKLGLLREDALVRVEVLFERDNKIVLEQLVRTECSLSLDTRPCARRMRQLTRGHWRVGQAPAARLCASFAARSGTWWAIDIGSRRGGDGDYDNSCKIMQEAVSRWVVEDGCGYDRQAPGCKHAKALTQSSQCRCITSDSS